MDVIPTIRADYLAYLQSQSWRVTRNRALRMARYRCQRCQAKQRLQVHHKTYERLGHELDSDLEVLCEVCHNEHHIDEKANQQTQFGLYVKLAWDLYRDEPYDSIAALAGAVKDACFRLKFPYNEHQVDRALALVTRHLEFRREEPKPLQEERELATSGPPCGCDLCVSAGISDRRIHRDPYSGEWLHGEDLRRWHEARDRFRALAEHAGLRSMPEFVALEDNYERDAERANQIRQQAAQMLRGEL